MEYKGAAQEAPTKSEDRIQGKTIRALALGVVGVADAGRSVDGNALDGPALVGVELLASWGFIFLNEMPEYAFPPPRMSRIATLRLVSIPLTLPAPPPSTSE